MKFGVSDLILHSRLGPMAMAEYRYRNAGIGGADSYWLADHLNALLPQAVMTAKYIGAARLVPEVDAMHEPWTALGYLTGRHRFNRARLGTCVTDTGRRNPAVTAQAAATLHLMTRGRAILGIGTGERVGNEPYGVDWSKPVAQVRRSPGNHTGAVELERAVGESRLGVVPAAQRVLQVAALQGHLARDLDRVARTTDATRDGPLRRCVVPGRALEA